MGYIDLNNLDSLSPELRVQATKLLEQFPQLKEGVAPEIRNLAPQQTQPVADDNTLDYAGFDPQLINVPHPTPSRPLSYPWS